VSGQTHPIEDLPTPDPTESPEEAVSVQVEALGDNDSPYENAGIMTAYNYASPANRRSTGPLDRFIEMVESQRYSPMIDSKEAVQGPIERSGGSAEQRVTVTGEGGRTVRYEFGLSVQSNGRFDGCWMTDSVLLVKE
jgi:hypothetical protein